MAKRPGLLLTLRRKHMSEKRIRIEDTAATVIPQDSRCGVPFDRATPRNNFADVCVLGMDCACCALKAAAVGKRADWWQRNARAGAS